MDLQDVLRRTWADISLDAIEYNFHHVKKFVGDTAVMAVVKADAYGHGDRVTAPLLESAGADWFGVSNLDEALSLRESGVTKPILILGNTPPDCACRLARHNITQTVYSLDYGKELSAAAQRDNVKIDIHIKLDTGMGRIGFPANENRFEECIEEVLTLFKLPMLNITGTFTHFASADEENDEGKEYTALQFSRFIKATEELKKRGVNVGLRHCCNSSATLLYPEMHLDMVRPGIILYGLMPFEGDAPIKLRPAMELHTVITMVKKLDENFPVSYGRKWSKNEKTTIATVPIGYADGLDRGLSGKGHMIVKGEFAPIAGTVCMDQTLLDVSHIEGVKVGDVVTVFGKNGEKDISVSEIAKLSGTICYETVCQISRRVPRCYYYHGENVQNFDYSRWKER